MPPKRYLLLSGITTSYMSTLLAGWLAWPAPFGCGWVSARLCSLWLAHPLSVPVCLCVRLARRPFVKSLFARPARYRHVFVLALQQLKSHKPGRAIHRAHPVLEPPRDFSPSSADPTGIRTITTIMASPSLSYLSVTPNYITLRCLELGAYVRER